MLVGEKRFAFSKERLSPGYALPDYSLSGDSFGQFFWAILQERDHSPSWLNFEDTESPTY